MTHRFVEPTPVQTADYRKVDEILAANARIATREMREAQRQSKRSATR